MRSLLPLITPLIGSLLSASIVTAVPLNDKRAATWTPAQGGCWTDNAGELRALDKVLGGFDDMTPAKCQSLCEGQGYSLAGVEYGRECFCGYTIFGENKPSSAGICNMSCSGDGGQICGGPDAINIYVKDNLGYTVGPASALPSHNGFENPRCWLESPAHRIFTGSPLPPIPADQMTVQKCINGCAAAGFTSAGLEFGRECYCGNEGSPLADQTSINDCNMPCRGDASQFCGGPDHLLIYHKPSTTPQPTPLGHWTPAQGGCWSDNVNQQRALHHLAGRFDDLTPTKCQALCENADFGLAGVEYGRECWCGNTIMGENRPAGGGTCSMACTGDEHQICGNTDAINIYVKDNFQYTVGPATVKAGYNGFGTTQCWQDTTYNRLLKNPPDSPISGDSMTVEKCIIGCAAAGYSSAGVEFGRECYCGNPIYPPGQSESMSECNMPCTGDATAICGGPDRLLIYYNPYMSVMRRGIILISHAVTNSFVGYLSKDVGPSGRMIYTTDISKAETIRYMGPSSQYTPVTRGEMRRAGAPGNLPFIGLIRGLASTNNNIGPGSANYLHLADTAHTDPGALPAVGPNSETAQSGVPLTIESSVWNIDAYSGSITAQWINSDGSTPTTTLATWGQSLIATGDLAALQAQFPNTYNPVRFQILFSP